MPKAIHIPVCKYLGKLDKDGDFYSIGELKNCLREWGVLIRTYSTGSLAKTIPPDLNIGDLVMVNNDGHILIVTGIDWVNKKIRVTDHHGDLKWDKKLKKWVGKIDFFCNRELVDYLRNYGGWSSCRIVHMPNVIKNCMDLKQYESIDSTYAQRFWTFFFFHCCWHEQLGGQAPWTSNPTPYACLSWAESRGTTTDSLLLPRINLAGCSSAVAVWACTTKLNTGGTRHAWILGSTDDGATWSETLAEDAVAETLTYAELPWATNQRKVRLAWVYDGPVQKDSFWCIDHVRILAKPTRDRDVSVSEIREPFSHGADSIPLLIPGKTIRPLAIVWNNGRQDESVPFTFEIDGGATYSDTKWMTLYPYLDTCIQFSPWTVTSGTHTAVCYAGLANDECPVNDTVTLSFRAVADTWVQRSKVYGGRGFARGAALATVDSNAIYCAPGNGSGKKYFFAEYVVSADLFYTRRPTIQKFTTGAGLTYPGFGDLIYAVKGGSRKYFWAYSIAGDTWKTLPATPFKVGNGGALAYGGNNRVYLLRGGGKRDFGRFNITTGVWSTTSARPPAEIGAGGSLVWTRGDTLYALRGGGSRDFYRYVASTDTWDSCASLPVTVNTGGALAYYPPGNIYAFVGGKRDSFYAYDIQGDAWSRRHRAPNKVNTGGALAYCNYAIYGGLGYQKGKYFWRYSPPVGGLLDTGAGEVEPVEQAAYGSGSTAGTPDRRLDPGELLTYDPNDKFTPQYSPNGLWIAYTAYDSARDCIGLYRIPANGGLAQALSSDSLTYEDPEWASSGAWLVAAGDDGIYKIASGTPPVRLAQGIASSPHVFGGDTWILYEKWDSTAHTHHVHKVRSDGMGDACLTPDANEYLEPQPISGSEFACVKLKDEVYQLSKDSSGLERWLTSDYMHNVGLDVSPDHQWLTYEKLDESGFWQVYKMRVNGTEETRVTDGTCDCETPVFSPNGQYIAYTKWPVDSTGSSEFSQVCYKDVINPVAEVALHNPDAERENPCWSPNCQYIIYEITSEDAALAPGHKKQKQIGRVRTRIKSLTGVEEISGLPRAFALYQNRPNPFGRTTTIRYALPVPSLTELSIYDVSGRTVTRLVQSEQKPGYYSVVWKGTDIRGRSVPAGTYFYILKSNGKIAQKRMLLVR